MRTGLAPHSRSRFASTWRSVRVSTSCAPQTQSKERAPSSVIRSAGISRDLQARYAVRGSYVVGAGGAAPTIRVNTVVTRLGEKDTIGELSDTGTEDQVVELIARHGERLRRLLKVPAQPAAAESLAQAVPSTAASTTTLCGSTRSDAPIRVGGRGRRAREIDSAAAGFRSRLRPSVRGLGRSGVRCQGTEPRTSDRARELAERLPREQQLLLNAQFFSTRGDWAAAIGVWRAVFGLYPDDLDYGLELAQKQFLGAERRAALDTLEAIRRDIPSAGADPRVDLAEAETRRALSQAVEAQTIARRAAERAKAEWGRTGGKRQAIGGVGVAWTRQSGTVDCRQRGSTETVPAHW